MPEGNRPRHPSPPPLRPNALATVAVITVLWVVALVVLLVFDDLLSPSEHWWRWVCVAGIALGFVGMAYFARSPFRR